MHLAGPVSSTSRGEVEERFVCDEFLSFRGVAVRWELSAWAGMLAQAMTRASSRREGTLLGLAECFRDAASIAEYLGRLDEARRIESAAIRYFSSVATKERRAEAIGHATMALVRLGRIEHLAGNIDDSLLHLGRVRSLVLGAELGVGMLRVSRAQWDSLVALLRPMAEGIALSASAEMLAALLTARRFEDVVSLSLVSRRGATDPPALLRVRKEAALSAFCRMNRPDEALALAARYTVEAGEDERALFEVRRAEVLACFGDGLRAFPLVEAVSAQLERKWRSRPGTLEDVRLAARVVRFSGLLGQPLGPEFCWTALAEALALGDVLLEAEMLMHIVETDWDEERRADAEELLSAVALGSGYRLTAAERLLSREEAPISSARAPLSIRSIEERAPGFRAMAEELCRMGEGNA